MSPVVNFHASILQMESLHILIAIFFVCLTTSFCFGLFTWQFFRSTNHAVTVLANYYSAFETRLKRIEHNINTLNSIFSQPQSSTNSGNQGGVNFFLDYYELYACLSWVSFKQSPIFIFYILSHHLIPVCQCRKLTFFMTYKISGFSINIIQFFFRYFFLNPKIKNGFYYALFCYHHLHLSNNYNYFLIIPHRLLCDILKDIK